MVSENFTHIHFLLSYYFTIRYADNNLSSEKLLSENLTVFCRKWLYTAFPTEGLRARKNIFSLYLSMAYEHTA